MKKIALLTSALISTISMADTYEFRHYLEKSNISFKIPEGTTPPDVEVPELPPTYGEWSNSGSPYDCTVWAPSKNTMSSGVSFTQTRSCSQLQSRTVNSGALPEETQVIVTNDSKNEVGLLSCPEYEFAVYQLGAYGSTLNTTLENPNYGTRIVWNGDLIFGNLDQNLKPDSDETIVGQFVYVRKALFTTRTILYGNHYYTSYDHAVCRYPL